MGIWREQAESSSGLYVESLRSLVHHCLGSALVACRDQESSAPLRVLSYKHDFAFVWGLNENGRYFRSELVTNPNDCHLVLGWDGIPSRWVVSKVNTEDHLTALDWAVSLSLWLTRTARQKKKPLPAVRITILDLVSHRHKAAEAVRYFEQFPQRFAPSLPWIRVYKPLGDGVCSPKPIDLFIALGLAKWRANGITASTQPTLRQALMESPEAEQCLEGVRRIWAARLAFPGKEDEHHALANLVGPLILRRSVPSGDLQEQAVRTLLEDVGLVAPLADKKTEAEELIACATEVPLLDEKTSWISWDENPWKDLLKRIQKTGGKQPDVKHILDCLARVSPELKAQLNKADSTLRQALAAATSALPDATLAGVIDAVSKLPDPLKDGLSAAHPDLRSILFGRPLNLVLIDDKAFEHGWAEVLRLAVGAQRRSHSPSTTPVLVGERASSRQLPVRVFAGASADFCWEVLRRNAKYEITEESIAAFRERDVPQTLLETLDRLRGAEFESDEKLFEALKHAQVIEEQKILVQSHFLIPADQRYDMCFKLREGTESKHEALCILLLDLRLHQGWSLKDEAKFYLDNLLPCARALQSASERGKRQLPWQGFDQSELARLQEWLARAVKEDASVDRSDREYIEVLTLLPRLLAMVDPSLPIVLFSSTGRRDVMELLKPYANILTGWEKPRLLTGGGDPAGDAAEQFRSVMLRALRLCHARRMIDELKAASDKESLPKFHSARDTDLPFVEVFVDEGRDVLGEDDPFRVGGVIAFHDNKDRADEFNRALVAQLCWGPTDLEPTIAQTVQLLHKEGFRHDEYESKVFAPAEQMAGSGTLLVGFSLSQPMSARPRWTDDLSSPWCLDNVHRFLVVEALEMALCEFIPSVLHADAFQAAVYVATRDRVKTDADTDVYWQSLPNRYGVRTYRRKDRDPKQPGRDREIDVFQSLSPSDVYPLVSHVRARRAGDMDKVTCLAARGAQLSYGRARLPEESRPRPTHHVADLVARFCLEQNLQRKMPTLYKWLQRGFQSVSDRNLDALLRACREAGDEHFAKALRLACNPLEADRIEEWAKRRVRRSVARVSSSGAEFMSFAAALAEEG